MGKPCLHYLITYAYVTKQLVCVKAFKKACPHIPGRQIVSNNVNKIYLSICIDRPCVKTRYTHKFLCTGKLYRQFVLIDDLPACHVGWETDNLPDISPVI